MVQPRRFLVTSALVGVALSLLGCDDGDEQHPDPMYSIEACRDGTFRLEAESGRTTFARIEDTAANDGIALSAEHGLSREAHYQLALDQTREYTLWLRLRSPSTDSDRLLIQIDGSQNQRFEAGLQSSFRWLEVGRFTLTSGIVILSLTSLEPDVTVDSLFLSPHAELTPSTNLAACDAPPADADADTDIDADFDTTDADVEEEDADVESDGDLDADLETDADEPIIFVPRYPDDVVRWFIEDTDAALPVRSDFFGCHVSLSTGWPDFTSLPAPTFGYGLVRSHGHSGTTVDADLQWARLQTDVDTFDWDGVSNWIAESPGRTRIFTIFGTPAFFQRYPGEDWNFSYISGGASPPSNPEDLGAFVEALLLQFPGEIDYVEIWSAPNFTWVGSDTDTTRWDPTFASVNGNPEFSGTAEDLAMMARAVREVLPDGTLLLAGAWLDDWENVPTSSMARFSNASDGAGGTGRDHVEAFSFHHYIYDNNPNDFIEAVDGYRARLVDNGYPDDIEFHCSEIGHFNASADELTSSEVAHNIRRATYLAAAMGVDTISWYRYSEASTLGAPHLNTDIAIALDDGNAIAGRLIRQAALLDSGEVWIRFQENDEVLE